MLVTHQEDDGSRNQYSSTSKRYPKRFAEVRVLDRKPDSGCNHNYGDEYGVHGDSIP